MLTTPKTTNFGAYSGLGQKGNTSESGASRGYAGLGQVTKGKSGEIITNKVDAMMVEATGNPVKPSNPSVALDNDKIYSQKDLEAILNRFTKNNPSLKDVQDLIKRSVSDEFKNIGNSGPNTATKYLRLPYAGGAYYKSAEWGPGGSPDTTGKTKYMVYQITDNTTTPPTAGWDWTRWV